MKNNSLIVALIAATLTFAVGCGDDEVGFVCTADDSMCATISAPADMTGTPVNLGVFGYASLPPAGPPTATLAVVPNPAITAGSDFELEATSVSASGDLFLFVVLYMDGGGTTNPVAGVDYVGASASAVTFAGLPLNVDPIELSLAQ